MIAFAIACWSAVRGQIPGDRESPQDSSVGPTVFPSIDRDAPDHRLYDFEIPNGFGTLQRIPVEHDKIGRLMNFQSVLPIPLYGAGEDKWNVPIGLLASKTTRVGKLPVKSQLGFEYSVVSQDDFGKRFLVKQKVIPVIRGLIKNPLLSGG